MKGYLSYVILWVLNKSRMNGAEISRELEKRRGARPSPGTLYPALKEMKEKGLITTNKDKRYTLTKKGKTQLKTACDYFCGMFYDAKDMFKCCGREK